MNWHETVETHYCDTWHTPAEVEDFSQGPIRSLSGNFAILRFAPRPERKMWTYATRGMSLSTDTKPIELHMFSPIRSQEVVELLVATAHFHRTSALLDVGHSVNFGKPWLGRSKCEYGFISLPYLDGPKLETLTTKSTTLSFYWLIPVTRSEIEFKKRFGLEALELEFDRSELDYLNPAREAIL